MNLGRSKGYPLCPQRLSLTRRVYQTVQRKRVVIGLLQNKILTNKKKTDNSESKRVLYSLRSKR